MPDSFFRNPLWRNFQNRKIRVVSLSEPEHRLRDALALIGLRDFLPPVSSGRCDFERVTVDGPIVPRLPAFNEQEGVVLLGRPFLFGPSAMKFISGLNPPLLYRFESNDPTQSNAYRTIEGPGGTRFESEAFVQRRNRRETDLKDGAILYAGWRGRNPLMILAGTSTVGTWGAAQYATSDVDDVDDVRWQQEVQGIIESSVVNRPDAFDRVDAHARELLSPVRIWMQGRELPPWDGWRAVADAKGKSKGGKGTFDLQILANGTEVAAKASSYVPALILLAWLTSPHSRSMRDGHCTEATSSEIAKRMERFLGPRVLPHGQIKQGLKALAKSIRSAGGIAYVEKSQQGGDRYSICARDLPSFLAHWDR
jgi:hypothetical protein